MPVTPEQSAPYAPTSAVLEIIRRFRDRGLTTPITGEVLARAGVTDSLISRTLQALQTLDLLDAEGRPTPVFEGIRLAPQAEYQQRLREWLNAAYADALNFVDPATASETDLRDAFRKYTPVGQQPRMVTLFSGLFQAAGVGPEKDSAPPKKLPPSVPKPRNVQAKLHRTRPLGETPPASNPLTHNGALPPALAGLLASLPAQSKGWTAQQRDLFIQTFAAVLNFCYPVYAQDEGDDEDMSEALA